MVARAAAREAERGVWGLGEGVDGEEEEEEEGGEGGRRM